MPLATGTRLGAYEIVAPLGAGGMGEVYRARDTRLKRMVAIKVLPDAVTSSPERLARFEREATTVAGLNHPNIVTLYSIEEAAGRRFLTMELVEGWDLSVLITPGGLPLARVLKLAIPLAEALVAAHEKGVVHRDLKPANVMLTHEGRIKVLDFGLAKLTDAQLELERTRTITSAAPLSSAGDVVGTAPYMSPEQIRGEPIDARTDLFSFGVLLYELVTGRRPFVGRTFGEVSSAILRDDPPLLTGLPADPPIELVRIVARCLAKPPRERYQTALEVLNDLRRLSDVKLPSDGRNPHSSSSALSLMGLRAVPRPLRTIAVLPLENLSGDPSQEYVADGMTESLIGDLARVRGLRVISRTSAMRYKGARRSVREIAAELNADVILEGSVIRGGDRFRINVQLIDAASDTHLWAERFDRALRDVLDLQSDVAKAIALRIRTALVGDATAPRLPPARPGAPRGRSRRRGPVRALAAGALAVAAVPVLIVISIVRMVLPIHRGEPRRPRRSIDPEVYDLYLRGLHQLNRRGDDSLHRAIALFDAAIARDPSYALAQLGLAEAHALTGLHGFESPREAFPRARAAAKRAMVISPGLGEAGAVIGYTALHHDRDWNAAERAFLFAIKLNPNHAATHMWYANALAAASRFDEALAECRRAGELDPLSFVNHLVMGWVPFFRRRFDVAYEGWARCLELEPGFFQAHQWRGWALWQMGKLEEASRSFDAAAALAQHPPTVMCCRATAAAFAGRAGECREIVARMVAMRDERYVSAFSIALGYLALGDAEGAEPWIERAADERSPWIGFMKVDPRVDALRGRPRVESLISRVGQGV
jgi:serine/threonine protein kinase/tetratricopeptide (TPR) repeat protein